MTYQPSNRGQVRHQKCVAVLTVAEDSKLVRYVNIVVVSLHCLINVKHGIARRVQHNSWTTHCGCCCDRPTMAVSDCNYDLLKYQLNETKITHKSHAYQLTLCYYSSHHTAAQNNNNSLTNHSSSKSDHSTSLLSDYCCFST